MTTLAQSRKAALALPEDEIPAAVAAYPSGETVVRAAWFSRAPKRLAASLASAEAVADDPARDLPAGIGRPATQALMGAGLTTLERVAGRAAAELLAMYGVGPKAVRVLSEALRERGLALRG